MTVTYDATKLRQVLADFSEASGRTFVRLPAVDTLRVSARFEDQPWDLALYSITSSLGLISRILPGGQIELVTLQEWNARQAIEPLETRIVTLQRARARELAAVVQGALSSRGRVVVDSIGNRLLITEITSRIEQVVSFISGLDKQ